jgi:23S rRNA pseudouridine1911/1915/1917 synthase
LRLDRLSQKRFGHVLRSRSEAYGAVDRGEVVVHGERKPPNYRVGCGDRIALKHDSSGAYARLAVTHQAESIPVVYQDQDLAVVWKRAGLATNGATLIGGATLEGLLPSVVSPSVADDALPAPCTVHRLDRATCGLVLVGKSVAARRRLIEMLAAREVTKRYRAVVAGRVGEVGEEAVLNTPVGAKEAKTRMRVVAHSSCRGRVGRVWIDRVETAPGMEEEGSEGEAEGNSSATPEDPEEGEEEEDDDQEEREPLVEEGGVPFETLTTVDLWPVTGRKHQLRLHMSRLGHPIVGDRLYGKGIHIKRQPKGLLLAACELQLPHPITGEQMTVLHDEPERFGQVRKAAAAACAPE